jgi:hypothetical protein
MSDKLDLKRQYRELYSAKAQPCLVHVPAQKIFAVDGDGDPNGSPRFQQCVEALYAVSFGLKFALKKERGLDWGVMGLEGDWWCDEMEGFSMEERGAWKWTLLIVQPEFIGQSEAQSAIDAARAKKGASPSLADLRFELRAEGEAAHILHIGPYDDEPPTIAKLHAFIKESGLGLTGRHRELYLSDARRIPPERLRTILRQPVSSGA